MEHEKQELETIVHGVDTSMHELVTAKLVAESANARYARAQKDVSYWQDRLFGFKNGERQGAPIAA